MVIERPNGDKIKVPISYGPKEKFLARLGARVQSGNRDRVAITMPRMAFDIGGMSYDSTRHLNKTYKFITNNNISDLTANTSIQEYTNNIVLSSYNPVTYDIDANLYVMSKTETDGALIMDKVMSLFSPNLNISIKLEPTSDVPYSPEIQDYIANFRNDINVTVDTSLVLTGVSMTDDYEGDFSQRRALTWTFTFTMKAVFFGPTRRSGIIKLPMSSINLGTVSDVIQPLSRTKYVPQTATKTWVEITIDDKDDIFWTEEIV
jgi:hypothetical protein